MSKKIEITNNIRKLRFFANQMTQQELAEKAGASRQTRGAPPLLLQAAACSGCTLPVSSGAVEVVGSLAALPAVAWALCHGDVHVQVQLRLRLAERGSREGWCGGVVGVAGGGGDVEGVSGVGAGS